MSLSLTKDEKFLSKCDSSLKDRIFPLPYWTVYIARIICFIGIGLNTSFLLLMAYSLSEEKYHLWVEDFIEGMLVMMGIKIVIACIFILIQWYI